MAAVRALVFDLNRSTPEEGQTFLVDTNVWFWTAYPSAPDAPQTPQPYQTNDYPAFLKQVLLAKAKLCWCALSWPELAHVIEITEYKIAKGSGAIASDASIKDYRHDYIDERKRVSREIKDAWAQVESLASSLGDVVIDPPSITAACESLSELGLDGYDIFLLRALKASGAIGIITDDGDFATVPKIKVYTANGTVIDQARRAGRLAR